MEVSGLIGECSKCGLKVKKSRCAKNTVAKLLIEDDDEVEMKVTAFHNIVEDLIRGQEGTDVAEEMLSTSRLKFTITRAGVISAISYNTV